MNYQKIHIQRFVVLYILVFGLLSSLAITLFAWFFGLTTIQENYSSNYVEATFQAFDTDMAALVKKNNQILFNITSDQTLLRILTDLNLTVEEKREEVQAFLDGLFGGVSEIRQIDILFPTRHRYTYVASAYDVQSPLPLPPESFLSTFTGRSLNLYDHCIYDQSGAPCLVFGRSSSIGDVLLYMNETSVSSMYESASLKNSRIFLSNNGRIISCSDVDYVNILASLPLKESGMVSFFQENPVYTHEVEILALGETLELTYILSEQDLYRTTQMLNRVLLLSLIVAVVACLILVLFVTRRLIKNIRGLQKNLNHFSKDYTHAFQVGKSSELGELEEQFVKMSEKIRNLIENIEKEKDAKRVAELRALQSQINPHFIYNSIDAISWMAKLKKPYSDIEKLSYHLGSFFRLGLHKGENLITVAEELQHVKSYLEIEKIRFPHLFEAEMEVEPEALEGRMLKIILQPLVENAINHGFKGIGHKGMIVIRIFSQGTAFVFSVEDNGRGMEVESDALPQSESRSGGYALKNVNERLILEYGSGSALAFASSTGSGTTVRFRIEKAQMR